MATIIDALLVTLGIDASKFKQGHKEAQEALKKTGEAAKKQNTELQEGLTKGLELFRSLRNEALAFIGVGLSGGALRQFVERITASDAATGRLAGNLGIATQRLSIWQEAAKRYGSNADDIAGAFRNINRISQEIKLFGSSAALPFLARAGVDIAKFAAASTTAEERMRMLVEAVTKLSPQDAQTFLQSAGFSEATITAMREMSGELDAILAKQEKLNSANERDKKLAIERQRAWADLADTFEGFGRKALNFLSPLFSGAVEFGKQQSEKSIWQQLLDILSGRASLGALRSGLAAGQQASGPQSTGGSSGGSAPRGIRNNNPGNLNFVGQVGASLEEHANPRFARFGTMAEGLAALANQLRIYQSRGVDTVQGIISKFAPAHENNTAAYIASVAKALGVGAGAKLNLSDPAVMSQLIRAITSIEVGAGRINMPQIYAAIEAGQRRGGGGREGSTTQVQVDKVEVHTKATDAAGIARDIGPAMRREYSFATQATNAVE